MSLTDGDNSLSGLLGIGPENVCTHTHIVFSWLRFEPLGCGFILSVLTRLCFLTFHYGCRRFTHKSTGAGTIVDFTRVPEQT